MSPTARKSRASDPRVVAIHEAPARRSLLPSRPSRSSSATTLRRTSRPRIHVWTRLLVEAGVVDSIAQLGTRVFRHDAADDLLGLTVTGRGQAAVDAACHLAAHFELRSVEVMAAHEADLIVVLADSIGPRKGTVTCDLVIPAPLWQVTEACRDASRNAAATGIPVMTLRRSALGEAGTLLSVLIAPPATDPPYDVACAAAEMIHVLREI